MLTARFVLRLGGLLAVLPPLVLVACSADSSSTPAAPEADGSGSDVDDVASDDVEDAGTRRDSGASKADGGKPGDRPDAGFDATPLACVTPGSPTTACANGVGTAFAASQMLPSLRFATSIELAVDKGGFYHAAWREQSTTIGVKYLSNRFGSFGVETVARAKGLPSEALEDAHLAVDDCGRPTVLYLRRHTPTGSATFEMHLYLATRLTGGWTEEEVLVPTSDVDATPGKTFEYADMTLDGAGRPVVVSDPLWTTGVVLSTKTATGWTHERLPTIGSARGGLPRVAWSSTLGLVLAYAIGTTGKPAIAVKSAGTWTEVELTGAAKGVDTFRSNDDAVIAINTTSTGAVQLAYVTLTGSQRSLFYSTLSSIAGGWTTPVAVPLPFAGQPLPLRVIRQIPGREPQVAFAQFNGSQMHTYVSTKSGAAFGAALDLGAYQGLGTAIDANGRVAIIGTRFVSTNNYQSSLFTQSCVP